LRDFETHDFQSRWVVKIGSALLAPSGGGLNRSAIENWAMQIAALRRFGVEVLLVSSGSILEGMRRLGWSARPDALYQLQAAAAVGQIGLAQCYQSTFAKIGLDTAQVLITHDDVSDRRRYLNARSTLRELLRLGVVPIINENDTVSTDEIMVGDNDTLAGLICNLVEAQRFVILTDQEGLFSADPRIDPSAELVQQAKAGDPRLEELAAGGSWLGKGGMRTKLTAASLAARSGTTTIIASGFTENILIRLNEGEGLGTCLVPNQRPIVARKQWLAGQVQVKGRVSIDDGAVTVLRRSGRSLLPVGVKSVEGQFSRGELVVCESLSGKEVARGLVNYSSNETKLIMGQPSARIVQLLGYVDAAELIHRDNLVLMD